MPTQECRASGSPLEATGLIGEELGADQRCSIGAGAGVLSASICCRSSCMNFRSAPDGFLHIRRELPSDMSSTQRDTLLRAYTASALRRAEQTKDNSTISDIQLWGTHDGPTGWVTGGLTIDC